MVIKQLIFIVASSMVLQAEMEKIKEYSSVSVLNCEKFKGILFYYEKKDPSILFVVNTGGESVRHIKFIISDEIKGKSEILEYSGIIDSSTLFKLKNGNERFITSMGSSIKILEMKRGK